ncbi:ATP-dependent DNA ligase LigD phosphoesterase module /ATP-dependent DNA ligase LigD polymerase module [Loktanella atrilutea]|uniref:DNA ligase (ATP) n=1 Tax=Loktanella atrilutea TaxID=366533 RepID=A0A1M4WXF2_LOKAT|nr:DNA ligase D [Loktanella atrilutea]SHE85909.1 ATP-dependent DNA ligase LigD phosphoesterase module /ATP-dependent DNA ligase LigD polymerase module [Loktanella atrilutea]
MARGPDPLAAYNAKRDFALTEEPRGKSGAASTTGLRFVVQKHDARRLHYDFRLEWQGVLLSWAVTRGPSPDTREKRLAVRTEDHPLSYRDFEGTIPAKAYGGGTVMLWDEGLWLPENDPAQGLKDGKLGFTLQGQRMTGSWALVRMKNKGEKRENWLLIKHRDSAACDDPDALTDGFDTSVTTGRTMAQIASGAKAKPQRKPSATQGGKRPAFRKPQLATLVSDAPGGDDWIFETKFDGYRCLAALGKGGPRLWTRNGHDWTDRFQSLTAAFGALPCKSALIDGEVMAARIKGSAFSSLQAALAEGRPLVFYAFDLLSLDGKDLTDAPLLDRKARLAKLLDGLPEDGPLRVSTHIPGDGAQILAHACKTGAEGIIAKRAGAPYRGRRTTDWLKVKCTKRQEFVIGGYSPSDKPGRPFASLLVGEMGPEGLRYRGRVGTGFAEGDFDELQAALRTRKTSPFIDVPSDIAAGAVWVTPGTVIEVDFTELTADGHIRHGSYLGLRKDKTAKEVTLEVPRKAPATRSDRVTVAGIAITHPDRLIFPGTTITKVDVARYYDRASARLMDIAGKRPLSLLRLPEGQGGESFFQKHAGAGFPAALHRVEITDSSGGATTAFDATKAAAFVAAAQMGTVEVHIWGARTDRLDRPDRLVFDLDPDEGLGWSDVRRAAFDLRDLLAQLDLATVPVVTGGKGIHVCVCLRRTQGWDTVKLFTKTVAYMMAEREPKRFTAVMSKSKRKGRIFIDWLRNERGATAIAPYAIRARTGGPVAVPVTWDALDEIAGADAFDIDAAIAHLSAPCPYMTALAQPQTLTARTLDALSSLM